MANKAKGKTDNELQVDPIDTPAEGGSPVDDSDQVVATVVSDGLALINAGRSKIDAAMAIYRQIEHLPQQTIVRAFIDGATLTEKGALTYWYNCRRKLARERRG